MGEGGWLPKPQKDSATTWVITPPTLRVAETKNGAGAARSTVSGDHHILGPVAAKLSRPNTAGAVLRPDTRAVFAAGLGRRLPALADLKPEDCYLSWELELRGDASHEDVTEVFAWVEDECDLRIEPLKRGKGFEFLEERGRAIRRPRRKN